MKRPIIITIILTVCVFGFISLSPAQDNQDPAGKQSSEEYEMLIGRIVSVDREKNEIVVKVSLTQEIKVIRVKAEIPPNIRVGKHVRIKLKKGTNEAEHVHKIQHG